MKTCLVTTAYITDDIRRQQTIKYLKYYTNPSIMNDMGHEMIYVMENGSSKEKIQEFLEECKQISNKIAVIHFEQHYPREGHLIYKYLWRALFNLQKLFKAYSKVIYTDNDFYVLNNKCANFIKNLDNCWASFYCHRHKFPETGIQILTKNNQTYKDFRNNNWDKFVNLELWNGMTMEVTIPVTVYKDVLIGDRYSEYGSIPDNVDYAAQVKLEDKVEYE